jgi:hypothetical protein
VGGCPAPPPELWAPSPRTPAQLHDTSIMHERHRWSGLCPCGPISNTRLAALRIEHSRDSFWTFITEGSLVKSLAWLSGHSPGLTTFM